MAKTFRQNTSYKDIANEPDTETKETENADGHGGNLGLPFGLCKKYGIALPDKSTPRDAWNALKGIGVYPPWTEEGKDQYEVSPKDSKDKKASEPSDKKTYIDLQKKKIYDTIREKLTSKNGFGEGYIQRLNAALENLSDEEIDLFAKTIDLPTINEGSGYYRPAYRELSIPSGNPTRLDKDLGYDFQANTFFHEYGHYIGNRLKELYNSEQSDALFITDFNESPEMQSIFREDAESLLSMISPGINLSRITREAYQDVYRFMREVTEKEKTVDRRIPKPNPPDSDFERMFLEKTKMYVQWGYSLNDAKARANEYVNQKKREYGEDLEKYKKALDLYNQREKEYNESAQEREQAKIKMQRMGFLSDFLDGATKGKFEFFKNGYWGHEKSYWTGKNSGIIRLPGKKNGVETWAEYFSFKMTKDTEGLSFMEKYIPKTFKKYEEIYSKMKYLL